MIKLWGKLKAFYFESIRHRENDSTYTQNRKQSTHQSMKFNGTLKTQLLFFKYQASGRVKEKHFLFDGRQISSVILSVSKFSSNKY